MSAIPVIAVFDIGKTNKKLFLFDEDYKIVEEESVCFPEIADEDGEPCEDVNNLRDFVLVSLQKVFQNKAFAIKAVNFSTYGASFVNVDERGQPVTPLYNYLKPFPPALQQQFYSTYGGEEQFSVLTASPVLGNLNSGMQLYWLKHAKPEAFRKIRHSLHLPQYMSFLLTANPFSDLTSIGCHTALWDFFKQQYHEWVHLEGIDKKLAPIVPSNFFMHTSDYAVGIGLHDSSAALIPYLASFHEPFVLLSTGTWCISLNPFNHSPLTAGELAQDCLCYLTYEGKPVKASRLFAGNEHEQQVKRIASHFNTAVDCYKSVRLKLDLLHEEAAASFVDTEKSGTVQSMSDSLFAQRELAAFASYEEAYHQLMMDIVKKQVASTQLVLEGTNVKRIFVDGGFGKNQIYMHLLAAAFPATEVFAASVAQASAMGAALAIHPTWNTKHLPGDIIELRYYSAAHDLSLH